MNLWSADAGAGGAETSVVASNMLGGRGAACARPAAAAARRAARSASDSGVRSGQRWTAWSMPLAVLTALEAEPKAPGLTIVLKQGKKEQQASVVCAEDGAEQKSWR